MGKQTVVHPVNGKIFRAKRNKLSNHEMIWRKLKCILSERSPFEKTTVPGSAVTAALAAAAAEPGSRNRGPAAFLSLEPPPSYRVSWKAEMEGLRPQPPQPPDR